MCYIEVMKIGQKPGEGEGYEMPLTSTAWQLKEAVQQKTNVDPSQIKLLFKMKGEKEAARKVTNEQSMQEVLDMAGEEQSTRLQLVIEMPAGGKKVKMAKEDKLLVLRAKKHIV